VDSSFDSELELLAEIVWQSPTRGTYLATLDKAAGTRGAWKQSRMFWPVKRGLKAPGATDCLLIEDTLSLR